MERFLFFRNTGVFPAAAKTAENPDGTLTVRLFDEAGAELAWYTVDAGGEGTDGITGEKVSLMR